MRAWIKRFRNWSMQIPYSWGLGQAEIHSSLVITLAMLSASLMGLSCLRPGYLEWRSAAFTLPMVWIVSLAVRIAAQQLAIGKFAYDSETTVGPSGNLRTDYEYLPFRAIFAYSIAGQLASLGLISIGLVVVAALSGASSSLTYAELFDVHGGWTSRAWASQIMCVNIFIFVLHLLPTVPFDMRATVLAMYGRRSRNAQEPFVFRMISALDSHLAAMLLGLGVSAAAIGFFAGIEVMGWYAALAAAVYLFVASRWERARAEELEVQYSPKPTLLIRQDAAVDAGGAEFNPYLSFEPNAASEQRDQGDVADEAGNALEDIIGSLSVPPDVAPEELDLDEILRKLHKFGQDALSNDERQALLSASRELKSRRGQAT